jgi:hypothetical protein
VASAGRSPVVVSLGVLTDASLGVAELLQDLIESCESAAERAEQAVDGWSEFERRIAISVRLGRSASVWRLQSIGRLSVVWAADSASANSQLSTNL